MKKYVKDFDGFVNETLIQEGGVLVKSIADSIYKKLKGKPNWEELARIDVQAWTNDPAVIQEIIDNLHGEKYFNDSVPESKEIKINEATVKPDRMFDEMISLGYLDSIVKDLEDYTDNSKPSNVKYQYEVIVHYIDEYLKDKSYKVYSREIDTLLELIIDGYFQD